MKMLRTNGRPVISGGRPLLSSGSGDCGCCDTFCPEWLALCPGNPEGPSYATATLSGTVNQWADCLVRQVPIGCRGEGQYYFTWPKSQARVWMPTIDGTYVLDKRYDSNLFARRRMLYGSTSFDCIVGRAVRINANQTDGYAGDCQCFEFRLLLGVGFYLSCTSEGLFLEALAGVGVRNDPFGWYACSLGTNSSFSGYAPWSAVVNGSVTFDLLPGPYVSHPDRLGPFPLTSATIQFGCGDPPAPTLPACPTVDLYCPGIDPPPPTGTGTGPGTGTGSGSGDPPTGTGTGSGSGDPPTGTGSGSGSGDPPTGTGTGSGTGSGTGGGSPTVIPVIDCATGEVAEGLLVDYVGIPDGSVFEQPGGQCIRVDLSLPAVEGTENVDLSNPRASCATCLGCEAPVAENTLPFMLVVDVPAGSFTTGPYTYSWAQQSVTVFKAPNYTWFNTFGMQVSTNGEPPQRKALGVVRNLNNGCPAPACWVVGISFGAGDGTPFCTYTKGGNTPIGDYSNGASVAGGGGPPG
jgi:hypothetical protein